MIATIVNVIAIIIGGTVGVLFGNKIEERFTKAIMVVMALITAVIGIQSSVQTSNTLILVVCLVLGTVIGVAIKLDDKINDAGEKIKEKLSDSKFATGRFGDAFVTASILFGVGSMTILGSIQAGINHNYSILFTKSVMDCVSAIAFSAALGPGVIFAAIPIFIVQGMLTLLAGIVEPFLTQEVINEMSAVGGPIFLGMAINILELRQERIKLGNMIPAIFLPILYFPIADLLVGLFG